MSAAGVLASGIRPQAVLRELARELRREAAETSARAADLRRAARATDSLRRDLEALDAR